MVRERVTAVHEAAGSAVTRRRIALAKRFQLSITGTVQDGLFGIKPSKGGNMGRTLSWVEHLLEVSRREIESRRPERALRLLGCVARALEVTSPVALVAQERMAEASLMLGDFRQARRCLRRAMKMAPESGKPYLLLARAIARDPAIDARKAGFYYRKALAQTPDDPRLFCEAGTYFVEMGRYKLGIACLQRAVDLAPEDLGVLASLVEALCHIERFEEARRVVDLSRFRQRRERRLDQLTDAIEFYRSCRRQRPTDAGRTGRRLLPFLRLHTSDEISVRQRRWRRDQAAARTPHLSFRRFHWDHERRG